MQYKSSTVYVALQTLVAIFNHMFNIRTTTSVEKIENLKDDIETNGLNDQPLMWNPKDSDKIEDCQGIRGFRRSRALLMLSESNPARFAELFPKGIPCTLAHVDAKQAALLMVDSGNIVQIRNTFEVYNAAKALFNVGCTESEVVQALAGLLDGIAPMRAKAKTEYDKLIAEGKLEDARKRLFDNRRGMIQHLHNLSRCPVCVEQAVYQKVHGVPMPGFENVPVPKGITNAQVTSLWDKHKIDLGIKNNDGTQMHSALRPGPNFQIKWTDLLEASVKKEVEGTTEEARPKAVSSKEITAQLDEGKWLSHGIQLFGRYVSGNKEANVGLAHERDAEYADIDIVRELDSTLFGDVRLRAKELREEQKRQDAEKAAEDAKKSDAQKAMENATGKK